MGIWMENYLLISAAVMLDLLLGDPETPFHPVRLIGQLIIKVETLFYSFKISKRKSGLLGVIFVLLSVTGVFIILNCIFSLLPFGKYIFGIFVFYISIAVKDLAVHGLNVKKALDDDNLQSARKSAGMILSRDTENISVEMVITGTLESISENSSDSIIAPVFWGVIFGPIGSLIYRTINTLDAMWGYKNKHFLDYGRSAALLDDAVNFIPARLTGVLICLASLLLNGNIYPAWSIMIRDHTNTASPNAGYPEAAMAGALELQLGGTAAYFGQKINKPTIGDPLNKPVKEDITQSIKIIAIAVFLLLLFIALLLFIV